jgi:predicted CopG family antitoxin
MAVKTITIDMESYELLAARKRPGESFSRVIKRTLRDERYTASHLLEHLDDVLLGEETVTAIEAVVEEREHDRPAPVDLEGEPCS